MGREVRKLILAGLLISIACMAYRACGDHILGSVAFSVGLILVLFLGADLFTGKVGYAKTPGDVASVVKMLVWNTAAAVWMGFLFPGGNVPDKLSKPIWEAFGSAVLCGVLVYAAVEGWRRTGQWIAIAAPTTTFVLIGGEHCIADAFWLSAGYQWSWYGLAWICVVMVGNVVGAKLANAAIEKMKG